MHEPHDLALHPEAASESLPKLPREPLIGRPYHDDLPWGPDAYEQPSILGDAPKPTFWVGGVAVAVAILGYAEWSVHRKAPASFIVFLAALLGLWAWLKWPYWALASICGGWVGLCLLSFLTFSRTRKPKDANTWLRGELIKARKKRDKDRKRELNRRRKRDAEKQEKVPQPRHYYRMAEKTRPVILSYPQALIAMRCHVRRREGSETYEMRSGAGDVKADIQEDWVTFPDDFVGAQNAPPGDYEACWERALWTLGEPRPTGYEEAGRDWFWVLPDAGGSH